MTREAALDAAQQYIHEKQVLSLRVLAPHPDTAAPSFSGNGGSLPGIQERRRTRRVKVATHIPARVHGTFALRLVDLSLGGARIEHLGQLRPGFPCALEFLAPVGPLSLATHVVRSSVVGNRRRARGDRHFRYDSGLAFAEVTADQETAITGILERVSRVN